MFKKTVSLLAAAVLALGAGGVSPAMALSTADPVPSGLVDTTTGAASPEAEPLNPQARPVPTQDASKEFAPVQGELGLPVSTQGKAVMSATLPLAERVAVVGATWPSHQHGTLAFMREWHEGRPSAWVSVEEEAVPATQTGRPEVSGTEPITVIAAEAVQVVTVSTERSKPTLVSYTSPTVDQDRVVTEGAPAQQTTAALTYGSTAISNKASVAKPAAPAIRTRADWGAVESLVTTAPRFARVTGVLVHHTAGSNTYTQADVPAILRGIYNYHVKTRGFTDIAYNILVDKYGTAWEGRRGGLVRAIQGGHTFGATNGVTFGLSYLGSYDKTQATPAMLETGARIIAWKFQLHGVSPWGKTRPGTDGHVLPAIAGHRDDKATECPGTYLYGKLPALRSRVSALMSSYYSQRHWTRDLTADGLADVVVSGPKPRILQPLSARFHQLKGGWRNLNIQASSQWGNGRVVNAGDMTGDKLSDVYFITAAGAMELHRRTPSQTFVKLRTLPLGGWKNMNLILGGHDVTGDRIPDVISRDTAGNLWLAAGLSGGRISTTRVKIGVGWGGFDRMALVPSFVAGNPALVARVGSTGATVVYPMRKAPRPAFLPRLYTGNALRGMNQVLGLSDINGDNIGDLLVTDRSNRIYVLGGVGSGWTTAPGLAGQAPAGAPLTTTSDGPFNQSVIVHISKKPAQVYRLSQWRASIVTPAALSAVPRRDTTREIIPVGDWDRDGRLDLMQRTTDGQMILHRGTASGFDPQGVTVATGWGNVDQIAAAPNFAGDGLPGVLALSRSTKTIRLYPGTGHGGFRSPVTVAADGQDYDAITFAGRWVGDSAPDIIARKATGELMLLDGNGAGLYKSAVQIGVSDAKAFLGGADWTGDGRPDLLIARRDGRLALAAGAAGKLEAEVPLVATVASNETIG